MGIREKTMWLLLAFSILIFLCISVVSCSKTKDYQTIQLNVKEVDDIENMLSSKDLEIKSFQDFCQLCGVVVSEDVEIIFDPKSKSIRLKSDALVYEQIKVILKDIKGFETAIIKSKEDAFIP